jgi:hypothetical protein
MDHVTEEMLFVGAVDTSGPPSPGMACIIIVLMFVGVVYYFKGDFRTWSVQQILTTPKDTAAANSYFGMAVDLDPYNVRTLAVGCRNCNVSGTNTGSVVLFEPSNPHATSWTQTQILSANTLYFLGGTDVQIYEDLVLADYCVITTPCASPNGKVMLFEKVGEHWDPRQTLGYKTPGDYSPGDFSVGSFAVYEDTIVLGVSEYDITYQTPLTDVGAVYILEPKVPSGKPSPRQWSIQQVLFAPTPTANALFGTDVSIDGNTMIVGDGSATANLYVYERETDNGKWSLQQTIASVGALTALELRGSAFSTIEGTVMTYYHRTGGWDCVLIELNDQFGDGWDIAHLIVETPKGVETLHGDVDSFEARCDLPNPLTFRYCPKDGDDVGPYRISIKDGTRAKHHWEILWRILEERTGLWHTGKWDTTVDMLWTHDHQFEIKSIEKKLSNNITCERCPTRPTYKPTPAYRRTLKGGGPPSTRAPTISHAPTLAVTDSLVNWRAMSLITTGLAWFDTRHNGASYYVSDAESHRLLHVGTMCTDQVSQVDCWVDLPDGIYVIRVGGDLSASNNVFTWRYCKIQNALDPMTQMIVEIANDDCRVLSHHTRQTYCQATLKFDAAVIVNVDLLILGATIQDQSLHSNDISVVKETLSNVIPGLAIEDITVMSMANLDGGVLVTAHIILTSIKSGYNLAEYEGYLSLKNLGTYMQGSGAQDLRVGFQSGSHANSFQKVTRVNVLSFDLIDSIDIPTTTDVPFFGALDYADTPTQDYIESESVQYSDYIEPVINGIALLGYVIAGTVTLFMSIIVSSRIAKMRKAKRAAAMNGKSYSDLEIAVSEIEAEIRQESASDVDDDASSVASSDDENVKVANASANKSTLRVTKTKKSSSKSKPATSKKVSNSSFLLLLPLTFPLPHRRKLSLLHQRHTSWRVLAV